MSEKPSGTPAAGSGVPRTFSAGDRTQFRGVAGVWKGAVSGIRQLRARGISVQINSTVAKHNVDELPDLLMLALELGCDALHIFMLVPVGCGLELAESAMLPAEE
jgi:AdoMet-dependent heme synthase